MYPITPEQRQKLANLLNSRQSDLRVAGKTGKSELDLGQLLPQMAAALESKETARLEAVVRALETERVIAPMPVEKPYESVTKFPGVKMSLGPVACIFSSANTFAAWQGSETGAVSGIGEAGKIGEVSECRPVPMSARKIALAAIAAGQAGFVLDPGQKHGLLIPREVVETLAATSSWLPPWQDLELLNELREISRTQNAASLGLVGVNLTCGVKMDDFTDLTFSPAGARSTQFALYLTVVQLLVDEGSYLSTNPRELVKIVAKLGTSPRLQATCWMVEFQPKIVAQT